MPVRSLLRSPFGRRAARGAAEGVGLVLVLLFVLAVTYLPHLDPPAPEEGEPALLSMAGTYSDWLAGAHLDHPFPIHVDENAHWVFMTGLQRDETLKYDDPYTGAPRAATPLSLKGLVHETGFHVALSQFQSFTGVGWLDLFRWLPSIWMGVTALLVWAALRPSPGALPAAALVALAPTSVRFLGPGFLVPIGFGLAWIAATLVVAPAAGRSPRTAVLLLLLTVWAFFIHLIVGFAALMVVLLHAPLAARRSRKEALLIAAIAAVPLIWLAAAFVPDVQREAGIFNFLPIDFTIFDQIGIPFLYAWVVALGLVVLVPPREGKAAVWVCTFLSLLSLAMIVGNVALDVRRYALYDRWHQIFLLFAAVAVGYGIGEVARLAGAWAGRGLARLGRPQGPDATAASLTPEASSSAPGGTVAATSASGAWPAVSSSSPLSGPPPHPIFRRRRPDWRTLAPRAAPSVAVGIAVLLGLAGFLGISDQGLGYHVRNPYYRITDRAEMDRLVAAAATTNDTYDVFLLHPWKAPIFTALTGHHPYTVLHPGEPPVNGAEYFAYRGGKYADGVWLAQREISQVVDPAQPTAPEYVTYGPQDARLAWDWAQRLAELRSR